MSARLTPRNKLFLDEWFSNSFNGRVAYQKIYGGSVYASRVNAARLLAHEPVAIEVERRFREMAEEKGITKEWIESRLVELAEGEGKLKAKIKPSDQLRALELLGRSITMFSDKSINENITYNPHLTEEELDRELEQVFASMPKGNGNGSANNIVEADIEGVSNSN